MKSKILYNLKLKTIKKKNRLNIHPENYDRLGSEFKETARKNCPMGNKSFPFFISVGELRKFFSRFYYILIFISN